MNVFLTYGQLIICLVNLVRFC